MLVVAFGNPGIPPAGVFNLAGAAVYGAALRWRASRPVRREWIRPELTQARGGNTPVLSRIGLSIVGLHLTRGGGITFNMK
jgi:hypothetical protein